MANCRLGRSARHILGVLRCPSHVGVGLSLSLLRTRDWRVGILWDDGLEWRIDAPRCRRDPPSYIRTRRPWSRGLGKRWRGNNFVGLALLLERLRREQRHAQHSGGLIRLVAATERKERERRSMQSETRRQTRGGELTLPRTHPDATLLHQRARVQNAPRNPMLTARLPSGAMSRRNEVASRASSFRRLVPRMNPSSSILEIGTRYVSATFIIV